MGALESEILAALWNARQPLTVRQVLGRLNERRQEDLAYTTVMTVLARMASKGTLRRTRDGRSYIYTPVAPDEAALAVHRVIGEHGNAAVAYFLRHAEADDDLRRRLQRIINGPQ